MSVIWLDEVSCIGVRSTLLSDADWGPNAVIRRSQDCRAILEANRREANAFQPEMQRNAIGCGNRNPAFEQAPAADVLAIR